jgi:hypothetical protein
MQARVERVPVVEAQLVVQGDVKPSPELSVADGLSEVTSFLERFEAEQKARRKAHNDRAALHRKALAQGLRPA